jgi:hypothetical protein
MSEQEHKPLSSAHRPLDNNRTAWQKASLAQGQFCSVLLHPGHDI